MHPEILSIALFWFVTAYTPGPNNVVASYSGFNFGITKTIPHILAVTNQNKAIDKISGCIFMLSVIRSQIFVKDEPKLLFLLYR